MTEEQQSGGGEQDEIHTINFIQLSRIYDVLMAILSHMDKDKSTELLEAHAEGILYATAPVFGGGFLTDMVNNPDSIDWEDNEQA